MARDKATITLDRGKAKDAMTLTGARSVSEVIDLALDRLVGAEQLRRDVAAYRQRPLGAEEALLANLPVSLDLGDEDVDYEALYGQEP